MNPSLDAVFLGANALWDRGKVREAKDLFKRGAVEGDAGCQMTLGYFYDVGLGGRKDRTKALFWYRKAYRQGTAIGAHNIGASALEAKRYRAAERWFLRAVEMGNADSLLQLGELYINVFHDRRKGRAYLRRVLRAVDETAEVTQELATELLEKTQTRKPKA